MLNEKELQERVNRRLSGLCADELRRRRILAAVHHEACVPPVRRLSPALVCLLIVLLVTGSIALADHLNLFSLFGRGDGRYAQVAQQADQVTASPVEIPDEAQNRAVAQIDSAFYDGLTLNLAFSIAQGTHYEPYVPDASELSAMEETEAMPVVIEHPQAPGAEVLAAYNQALENATPCGYRAKIIYASDHTLTDDGIDLPPYAASVTYAEDGACHEMREFESPLPARWQKGSSWSFISRSINRCRRSTLTGKNASLPSGARRLVRLWQRCRARQTPFSPWPGLRSLAAFRAWPALRFLPCRPSSRSPVMSLWKRCLLPRRPLSIQWMHGWK